MRVLTGESVDAAVKILNGVKDEGPNAIVLATDSEPDSCSDPNLDTPAGLEVARQLSFNAVQHAFKAQITTFVISVGNQVGQDHLRDVANVGQGLAVDVDNMNRFYLGGACHGQPARLFPCIRLSTLARARREASIARFRSSGRVLRRALCAGGEARRGATAARHLAGELAPRIQLISDT